MEWPHTVWPEAKLVYTSFAKVANTSIKTALLASFIPHVRRKSPHDDALPYVATKASRIHRDFPDFCHFAVVRNPFDRLVSFWSDKIAGDNIGPRLERLGFRKEMPFDDTVRKVCEIKDRHSDPHFRSQTASMVNHRSELRIDLALRFERLEEEWDLLRSLVAARTGAEMQPLPYRRTSERQHAAEYYDDATTEMAVERYAADFELLEYPRDPRWREPSGDTEDGALGVLLDRRPGASVLDLSAPSAGRAARVGAGGGRYLGSASKSPVGQLVKLEALSKGRVPLGIFDVLVVHGDDRRNRPVQRWIRRQFEADGRQVLTEPRTSGRPRWRRCRAG